MRDNSVTEKRCRSQVGMIDELISDQQVARRNMLLHAAGRAHRDQPLDSEFFHPPQVGAIIQLARQYPMATAMARQEDDLDLPKLASIVSVGRLAERRV